MTATHLQKGNTSFYHKDQRKSTVRARDGNGNTNATSRRRTNFDLPTSTASPNFDVNQSIDCRGTFARQRAATVAVQVLFVVADTFDKRAMAILQGKKEGSARAGESDTVATGCHRGAV